MLATPDVASTLAVANDGVISVQQALTLGMSRNDIRALVRAGIWRRVTHAVYLVDADLYEEIPRRAVLRAAQLRYGDEAVFWGETAAEVLGIRGVVGWPGRPWVLVPLSRPLKAPADARLRFRERCSAEIVTIDGFQATRATRTLADLVALVDRPTGLSLLDSALHEEQISPEELTVVCAMAKGRRGAPKVRELVRYADGRAANPLESRVRLACIDGDVPPDELQWEVFDEHGRLLGIADLAWFKRRLRPPTW